MEALSITVQPLAELKNTTVASFDGDFDGGAKENLTEVQGLVDSAAPQTTLILDFSNLNFLNSYAIGHLVAWHQHLSKAGGKIIIVGTNKHVEDIFAIVGIHNLFKIYPDLAAAVATLKV